MSGGVRASLICRAILFDLDGVLADSAAVVERSWRAWAERVGLEPDGLLRAVHGRRAVDTVREQRPALDADAELAWLIDLESRDTEGITAIPGAAALLAALPWRQWGVVTSGVRAVALARLAAVGLPEPPLLVAADEIRLGKPHPEGYLTAAARLGVTPADCVVVEDAPAGAAAARAAGMRLVAVTTSYPAAEFADADLVVPDLAVLALRVEPGEAGGAATLVLAAA